MMTSSAMVFVIDDDEAVRKSLGRLLGAAHYRIELFKSASEFLWRSTHPGPSVRWTLLWGQCKSFEEADDDLSTLACTRCFRLFGPGANSGASAAKIGHEFSRRHGVSQLYTEGTVQLAWCKDACAARHDLVSSGGFSGGATITSPGSQHFPSRKCGRETPTSR